MIQSTSASFFRSSSKLPTVTRCASELSKKAAGLDFLAASRPAAAILLRFASGVGRNYVEQITGHASIGEVGGDSCAHGAGA